MEAGDFIEVLTGDFSPSQTDSLPFPEALKPILREALGGYFQLVLELQHQVLLIGLDKKDTILTIQGKDNNRLLCLQFLLPLQELMEKRGSQAQKTQHSTLLKF